MPLLDLSVTPSGNRFHGNQQKYPTALENQHRHQISPDKWTHDENVLFLLFSRNYEMNIIRHSTNRHNVEVVFHKNNIVAI